MWGQSQADLYHQLQQKGWKDVPNGMLIHKHSDLL